MRKRIFVATLATWAAVWSGTARADRGGPDRSGYEWVDSLEEQQGATYQWVDVPLEQRTVVTGLGDDAESSWVDLGFAFSFFGSDYEQAIIGSNGYISFQENPERLVRADQCPLPAPNSGPDLAIYGFYQDLNPDAGDEKTQIYYSILGEESERQFIVSFESVPFYQLQEGAVDTGQATFQIVLYEGSNEIQINVAESGKLRGRPGPTNVAPTTMGVENAEGTTGMGRCDWTAANPMPAGEYAMRIRLADGIALSPDRQRVTSVPGRALTVPVELLNFSTAAATVSLAVTSEQGWEPKPATPVVAVPPMSPDQGAGEVSTELSVTVPADAHGADRWNIVATAGTEQATASVEVALAHGSEKWHNLAELPDGLSETQLVAAEGYVYALGGERLSVHRESGPAITPVASTFRWSPETNGWEECIVAPLPYPVTRGDACAIDGKLYYVGGLTADPESGPQTELTQLNEDLLVYDIAKDRWDRAAAPPSLVAEATVVCDKEAGHLFVYGGYVDVDHNGLLELATDENPNQADTTAPLFQQYDVLSDSWRKDLQPLGAGNEVMGRARAAMALVGTDTIYLAGGSNHVRTDDDWSVYYYSAFYAYSISNDQWTLEGYLPRPNGEPLGVNFRGQFCIVGGAEASVGPVASWYCYIAPDWIEQLSSFSYARYDQDATVMDDHLYIAGGVVLGGQQAVDRFERWPASTVPAPVAAQLCSSPTDADPVVDSDPLPPTGDSAAEPPPVKDDAGGWNCAAAPARQGQGPALLIALLSLFVLRRRQS
jgi:hypothetical protein